MEDIRTDGASFRKGWELAEELSDRLDVDLDLNTLEAKTGSLALILHDILVELEEMGAEKDLDVVTRLATKVATEQVDFLRGES